MSDFKPFVLSRAAPELSSSDELKIDKDALSAATSELLMQANDLRDVKTAMQQVFDGLRNDWKTPAGKAFFDNLDSRILAHIESYAGKLELCSERLTKASYRYEGVFEAADAVANAHYS